MIGCGMLRNTTLRTDNTLYESLAINYNDDDDNNKYVTQQNG